MLHMLFRVPKLQYQSCGLAFVEPQPGDLRHGSPTKYTTVELDPPTAVMSGKSSDFMTGALIPP